MTAAQDVMTLRDALLGGPGLDGYAYNADVLCVDCGKKVTREVFKDYPDGIPYPEARDSEVVPQPIFFGESDNAEYCSDCGEFMYGSEDDEGDGARFDTKRNPPKARLSSGAEEPDYAYAQSHGPFGVVGLGVHIDGTFGQDHAVQKMLVMLQDLKRRKPGAAKDAEKLIAEFEDNEEFEFADEWLDDATDLLGEYTAPGYVWEWDAGDLILREDDGEEEA